MPRVGIVGAAEYAGGEVALRLHALHEVEVAAVCPNRLSSAFLRHNGLACRHGFVSTENAAAVLLGDCDCVAIFSISDGLPREVRAANTSMIRHAVRFSAARAKIIYVRTETRMLLDASAREQLRCE